MGKGPQHIDQPEPAIISGRDLAVFFSEQVGEAVHSVDLCISSEAEFYLVSLLLMFTDMQAVSALIDWDEPLALMLGRALKAPTNQRIKLLRGLGDRSLFISGFFPASLNQEAVDRDYYAAMGCNAYAELANFWGRRNGGKGPAGLYDELAREFVGLVDVLQIISEQSAGAEGLRDIMSLMRLYERWRQNGSARLHSLLSSRGLLPRDLQ